MQRRHRRLATDLRSRLCEILEEGAPGDRTSFVVSRLIILLILINLIAVALESVPDLAQRFGRWFDIIELVSLAVFTLEYVLRLWVAVDHAPYRHYPPLKARWKYASSAVGIIDFLSVLPFWIAPLLPTDLRFILVFRIVRFLKIARYSPAMRSLLDVLYRERRALLGCVVILLGTTLIAASLMHLAEGRVQPDKLGTIPDAMWWAIVTLGTIGYGDIVPVTVPGKFIAAVTIFLGLIMIALPVGIIANAFSEEIHRRDFVVTWGMVARVPLFSGLDADEIASIMRLLRAQQAESGEIIVRRGDTAHSMYLIASGAVEIQSAKDRVRLGEGQFFGEIAVLRRARRSATIVAVERTNLLVLDARDLHALMDRNPRIAERLHAVARERLGKELVTPRGDLITEEIAEGEHEH
jgi:voltage-gated potassium channel